jgi:hypothetical protein
LNDDYINVYQEQILILEAEMLAAKDEFTVVNDEKIARENKEKAEAARVAKEKEFNDLVKNVADAKTAWDTA